MTRPVHNKRQWGFVDRYAEGTAEARRRSAARHTLDSFGLNATSLTLTQSEQLGKRSLTIELKRGEVTTLRIAGHVTIVRQIWPPSQFKLNFCSFIQRYQARWVKEECKYFGADPETSIYKYGDDPLYVGLDWPLIEAIHCPIKARRLYVICRAVERSYAPQRWTIDLELGGQKL